VSNVISMPNPIVTADVPSGNIRPVSSTRPERPRASMATTAAAPITSANRVAHAAVVSERVSAPIGSIPICRPGRISVPSSDRHAAVE
jgi:hypothetical protein